jgi:hypothetical protein
VIFFQQVDIENVVQSVVYTWKLKPVRSFSDTFCNLEGTYELGCQFANFEMNILCGQEYLLVQCKMLVDMMLVVILF